MIPHSSARSLTLPMKPHSPPKRNKQTRRGASLRHCHVVSLPDDFFFRSPVDRWRRGPKGTPPEPEAPASKYILLTPHCTFPVNFICGMTTVQSHAFRYLLRLSSTPQSSQSSACVPGSLVGVYSPNRLMLPLHS